MADIIINGINLTSGQQQTVSDNDILTTNDNLAIRAAGVGASRGLAGPSPRGVMGLTGPQGETGLEGYPGITGAQGITGTAGIRGATMLGETGAQGFTGFFGRTGLIGATGVAGTTGAQGYAAYSFLFGATTITDTAEYIGLASTGGAFTVTLPSATGVQISKTFVFQDQAGNADINNISIYSGFVGGGPDGSWGSINGNTGIIIDSPYMAVEIYSNGNRYIARVSKTGSTGIQGETGVQGNTGVA